MKKKLVSLALAIVLMTNISFAENFNNKDIESNDWYYNPIKSLYDRGFIRGYDNGNFKPNNSITREESAQVAYKVASVPVMEEYQGGSSTNGFVDVSDERWSSQAIEYLRKNEIVCGKEKNRFYPMSNMTREEAAVLTNRILDFREVPRMEANQELYVRLSDSDEISSWARAEVTLLYNNSIIKGYPDNSYRPKENITRAEFMSLRNKVLEEIESSNK